MSLAAALPFSVRHLVPITPQYRELLGDRPLAAECLNQVRGALPREVVDEIAIPSYTHRNPLMRYLFWERLAAALEWIDRLAPRPTSLLDFGSGMGLLFPALARRGIEITACDIHPEVTKTAAAHFGVQVNVVDARQRLGSVPGGSVDVVLALDVLEHIPDVRSLGAELRRILRPEGRLLCSLPTENLLYRMGRRLAGFSGAYHLRGSGPVVADLASALEIRRVARLYWFLPLFEFFEGRSGRPEGEE
jgi:SAM-dependent methyltransferase